MLPHETSVAAEAQEEELVGDGVEGGESWPVAIEVERVVSPRAFERRRAPQMCGGPHIVRMRSETNRKREVLAATLFDSALISLPLSIREVEVHSILCGRGALAKS